MTRQISFNMTKIGGKGQNSKIQMRHFWGFPNNVWLQRTQRLEGMWRQVEYD